MSGLKDISFHVDLDPVPESVAGGLESVASVEAIARQFLEGPGLESVAVGPVSAFEHVSTTEAPANGKLVAFQQTYDAIPIFGARPVVALDGTTPVSVTGRAAGAPDVPPAPKLSEAMAIAATKGTSAPERVELVYYFADTWHLAYHVQGIVVPHVITGASAHGPGGSPRADAQLRDVLVDANDGAILVDYSATPLVAAISPTATTGLDEDDVARDFYTTERADGTFEMRDGLNVTATFDAAGADIELPRPTEPVRADGGDWRDTHRAAVSAHHNAIVVLDYFRTVFKRAGVDNQNGELVSIVRSTYAKHETPPTWRNAVWWKGAMWYGQEQRGDRLISFATRLEIAAHEMTHGLTEKTAGLIYWKESGALNESFSDILGIIIANSAKVGADSTAGWSWIIGAGLGRNGNDIRDLQDPARVGYPDHYTRLDPTDADSGGVHVNSNIHNKAAYNVLTARDAQGQVFRPAEVALLYYLALLRLGTTSNFRDALGALLHATATLYKTKGAARPLEAVRQAYGAVGIEA